MKNFSRRTYSGTPGKIGGGRRFEKRPDFRWDSLLLVGCIMLIPGLHLGFTYYISIMLLAFAMFAAWIVSNMETNRRVAIALIVGLFVPLAKCLHLVAVYAVTLGEVLVAAREYVCYSIMIFGIVAVSSSRASAKIVKHPVTIVFVLLCAAMGTQYLLIRQGSYIGFPLSWFTYNQGNLVGLDYALYYATKVRPAGFYGEPSYAGFILASLLLILLQTYRQTPRRALVVTVGALTAGLLSQSIAGIVAVIVISTIWWFGVLKNDSRIVFSNILAFGVGLVIVFGASAKLLHDRVNDIVKMDDVSFNTRLLEPWIRMSEFGLNEYIFGHPVYQVSLVDNALLGLFLHYGAIALFYLAGLIIMVQRILPIVYVLLAMCFNGGIFTYDKAFVVTLAVGSFLYYEQRQRSGQYYNR